MKTARGKISGKGVVVSSDGVVKKDAYLLNPQTPKVDGREGEGWLLREPSASVSVASASVEKK